MLNKIYRISQDLQDYPPISRAIPKAAPAARLPINAVWSALRSGRVPVKRPFTNPKTSNATSVNDGRASRFLKASRISNMSRSYSGVPRQAIWIDPGIGFGKTPAHNLSLIAHLRLLDAVTEEG